MDETQIVFVINENRRLRVARCFDLLSVKRDESPMDGGYFVFEGCIADIVSLNCRCVLELNLNTVVMDADMFVEYKNENFSPQISRYWSVDIDFVDYSGKTLNDAITYAPSK